MSRLSLNPDQITLILSILEEVENSGFKSEELVLLSKDTLFAQTLLDLKKLRYANQHDEENE